MAEGVVRPLNHKSSLSKANVERLRILPQQGHARKKLIQSQREVKRMATVMNCCGHT